MTMPAGTGVKSTSFVLWLATFLPGIAALVHSQTAAHSATSGLIGGALVLVSTLAKLFHDQGIHIASIKTAASDVAAATPALTLDAETVIALIKAAQHPTPTPTQEPST